MDILYICSRNYERSPAAEALTRKKLKKRDVDIKVRSAALDNLLRDSYTIHPHVDRNLRRMGVTYDGCPTRFDPTTVTPETLILTMDTSQGQRVQTLLGGAADYTNNGRRVYTLQEFATGQEGTIPPASKRIQFDFLERNFKGFAWIESSRQRKIKRAYRELVGEVEFYVDGVVERICGQSLSPNRAHTNF